MLGKMAGPSDGGVSEQRQRDFGRRHTGTAAAAAPPLPPPPVVPPKLFLAAAAGSGVGVVVSGEEALFSPPAGAGVVMVSPTSTLQAPAGSPTTSPAAPAVPFSRRGAATSPSSAGDDGLHGCIKSSRSRQRPWEARPVGVGLAGALMNGDAADAIPPAAATVVLTTGQRFRTYRSSASSAAALLGSGSPGSSSGRSRCVILSPREREVVMEAASASEEDYTRVIARGAHPRTTHIFEDRVVVVEEDEDEDEFLRWCHGCSRDLRHGNEIFTYRGEMAFCSHECRYREMLLFDGEEESS